jgi:hypothetical protein
MSDTMQEIKDLIVAKLQGLTNSQGKVIFGDVFGYAEGDFTKYPAIAITPVAFSGETIDTHRIERTLSFEAKLYQEQSVQGKTKSEADDLMTEAADAVLHAFDIDSDLTDEVQKVEVISGTFDFKTTNGTFNFATFRLDCKIIINNY